MDGVTMSRAVRALGRALLSDPAWPTKLRDGRLTEIRPYDKTDENRLT
jgi:2,4-dienoyl-CoA reductase-like NADH-dependent reductase (Old Yellow Enzyme family)